MTCRFVYEAAHQLTLRAASAELCQKSGNRIGSVRDARRRGAGDHGDEHQERREQPCEASSRSEPGKGRPWGSSPPMESYRRLRSVKVSHGCP